MKRLTLLIVFGISVIFSAHSQQTIQSIIDRGEFRVGLTGNQPPYNMKNRSGDLMGFEVDLAQALAGGMGVKLNIEVMPFSDLLPALNAGKIDAIMSGMTVTAQRSTDVLFAGPYTVSGKSILAKTANIEKIKGTDAANNPEYRITCLKGSTSETFARASMPKAQIVAVDNYDDAIAKVINDEADAMVADFPICVITVMRNQGSDLVTLEAPLNIEPIGMALPAGDVHFHNLVENYLSALQISGALKILNDKWINDGSWLVNLE